jgi:hypothetical protein
VKVTKWIIIIVIAGIIIVDIVLYAMFGRGGTLSSVIIAWSKAYPLIPFLAGLLMGHFFWED